MINISSKAIRHETEKKPTYNDSKFVKGIKEYNNTHTDTRNKWEL